MTDMKIYLASVMGVANATVAPFDFTKTVQTLRKAMEQYAAAAGSLTDFTPSRTALDTLEATLTRFALHVQHVSTLPVTDAVTKRTNHAIRRMARLLVPVNYTRGPAFFHDPAETTPALPDLAPALGAASMSEGDKGFLATHLVRGQNRLVAALRDCGHTLELAMAGGR